MNIQFLRAATIAMEHASSNPPSKLRQIKSALSTQTHLDSAMHSFFRSIMILLFTSSAMN